MLASVTPTLRYIAVYKIPGVCASTEDPIGYLRQEDWRRFNEILSRFACLETIDLTIQANRMEGLLGDEILANDRVDAIRDKFSPMIRDKLHVSVIYCDAEVSSLMHRPARMQTQ